MKSLTPVFLSILCVLSSVTAVPDHDILEPMSDDDWPGLEHRKHKRDVHQAVTLQQSEHFVWGSQNNTATYANMTLNTKDEELVISMERFASELRSVTCGDNLVMTFTSNETYTHVINEWEWVNFHESRTFILIENYAGCGTQSSRQPWVVSNAKYDNAHQTVHLNATKKTWQEVAHTYSMDFGKYTAAASASNETKRGLAGMPDVSASGTKTFSIPLAKTLPSTLFKSTTYESLTFGVDCNTCGTKGTLELTGHVESSIKNGLTTFSVSAVPKSVSANLALKLSAKGSLGKTWTQQATFLTVAVPGFSIPQVLTVGPNLRFDGGMTVSKITGSAEISSGITATVPDSSTASVDFVSKAVDVKGWVPTFSAQPVTFGAQVDAEVSLYLQVAVALSLNCLGTGFSVDLDLKIPEVDIKAEAKYDSKKAVCPNATKNGGVSINTSAGAAMTFEAYSMIASKKSVLVNKPVFNSPKAFTAPSVCLPFDGPGAGAAPAKGGKAKRYEGASAPGRRQY